MIPRNSCWSDYKLVVSRRCRLFYILGVRGCTGLILQGTSWFLLTWTNNMSSRHTWYETDSVETKDYPYAPVL